MLCYVMLCYVMLCYVMLCYVMLCYVMLCYVMLLQRALIQAGCRGRRYSAGLGHSDPIVKDPVSRERKVHVALTG